MAQCPFGNAIASGKKQETKSRRLSLGATCYVGQGCKHWWSHVIIDLKRHIDEGYQCHILVKLIITDEAI